MSTFWAALSKDKIIVPTKMAGHTNSQIESPAIRETGYGIVITPHVMDLAYFNAVTSQNLFDFTWTANHGERWFILIEASGYVVFRKLSFISGKPYNRVRENQWRFHVTDEMFFSIGHPDRMAALDSLSGSECWEIRRIMQNMFPSNLPMTTVNLTSTMAKIKGKKRLPAPAAIVAQELNHEVKG